MLHFDVALYPTRDAVAHKVRRYKNGGSVGVYLRRWVGHLPDVKVAPPWLGSVTIVAFTQRCNRTSLAELLYPIPANG